MRPEILYSGISLFLLVLLIHVILWRWKRPQREIQTFVVLFLLPVVAYAFAMIWWGKEIWQDLLSVVLLYLSLSVAYIQTYPAAQALSPSLRILILVGRSGSRGMTEEEVFSGFDPQQLLEDRIQDLLKAGFVLETEEKIEITPRGVFLAFPVTLLRKILGLPLGRG